MKTVLTIAGSDSSGGAGIQADIKTITMHGMYASSAIAALTAQNTMGVREILEVSPGFMESQIDCVFEDIPPDAVKIGMVSNAGIIEAIAGRLIKYGAKNIVADPVMVSTSGSKLISDEARDTLIKKLLPLARVITPNIPEAEILSGLSIRTREDMLKAAEKIAREINTAVLLKGGHLEGEASDLLYEDGEPTWFFGKRIDNPNTHGTGCTLSSAIACGLAGGKSLKEGIESAKAYIEGAIAAGLSLGRGRGPIMHNYALGDIKY